MKNLFYLSDQELLTFFDEMLKTHYLQDLKCHVEKGVKDFFHENSKCVLLYNEQHFVSCVDFTVIYLPY